MYTLKVWMFSSKFLQLIFLLVCGCSHVLNVTVIRLQSVSLNLPACAEDMTSHLAQIWMVFILACMYRFWNWCAIRADWIMTYLFHPVLIFDLVSCWLLQSSIVFFGIKMYWKWYQSPEHLEWSTYLYLTDLKSDTICNDRSDPGLFEKMSYIFDFVPHMRKTWVGFLKYCIFHNYTVFLKKNLIWVTFYFCLQCECSLKFLGSWLYPFIFITYWFIYYFQVQRNWCFFSSSQWIRGWAHPGHVAIAKTGTNK